MTERQIIHKLKNREVNDDLVSDIAYVLSLDYDKTCHWILDDDYKKEAFKNVANLVVKSKHKETYLKELKIN